MPLYICGYVHGIPQYLSVLLILKEFLQSELLIRVKGIVAICDCFLGYTIMILLSLLKKLVLLTLV